MLNAPDLRVANVTSRTAVVLMSGPGIRFRLPGRVSWILSSDSALVQGTADTSAVVLDQLVPATDYVFTAGEREIRFTTPACAGLIDARDFGIDSDSEDNADAFADAISAVPDGGTLWVPPGYWRTGPIFLRSRMTLNLAGGAHLAGIAARSAYPILPAHDEAGRMLGTWEGLPEPCFASLLTAIDCDGLAIVGKGTVDGGADAADWWSWPKETRDGARRPRTVFAVRCSDLSISGVTFRNSPSWTVHPVSCTRLRVAGVRIWNPSQSPNTDGLNPEMCRDVVIEGTEFSVGDDCIAIKAGKRGDRGEASHLYPTKGVVVRNCRMERGHGAVVIGSEMSGSVTDVRIENCEFDNTDRGLRIKSRRGRGGTVSDIAISDCSMDRVDTAFAANAHYFCDHDGHSDAVQNRAPAPVTDLTPTISDITVEAVDVRNARIAVGAFLGLSEAPISRVSIRSVRFNFDPEAQPKVPLMADNVPPIRHTDLWAENADVEWEGRSTGTHSRPPTTPIHDLLRYFDAFAERYDPYKRGNWCYEDGVIYLGLAALHRATGDSRWFAHLRRLVDVRISPDGTIDGYDLSEYNIDNILAGRCLFYLSDQVGDRRYRIAADMLASQLRDHPRTADGNYWHKLRYPWQVWLDGLYMGLPFQIEFGLTTGQPELVEDALSQLRMALGLLFKPTTGLHAHAYDEKRQQPWADPLTGQNRDHWSRANGWLAMALVDVCGLIGRQKAEQESLLQPTIDVLGRIAEFQTEHGLWLQVPDRPTLDGNFEELSASAMFTYSLLKAVRLDLGGPPCAGSVGRAGFDALAENIIKAGQVDEGTGFGPMCHVAGLGVFEGRFRDGTAEYYVTEKICEDDPKGVGPMMTATAETILSQKLSR